MTPPSWCCCTQCCRREDTQCWIFLPADSGVWAQRENDTVFDDPSRVSMLSAMAPTRRRSFPNFLPRGSTASAQRENSAESANEHQLQPLRKHDVQRTTPTAFVVSPPYRSFLRSCCDIVATVQAEEAMVATVRHWYWACIPSWSGQTAEIVKKFALSRTLLQPSVARSHPSSHPCCP